MPDETPAVESLPHLGVPTGKGGSWSVQGFTTEPDTSAARDVRRQRIVTGKPPAVPAAAVIQADFARAVAAIDAAGPAPEPVKLTRSQIDALPKAAEQEPGRPSAALLGVPVIEVATVEESTPYELARVKEIGTAVLNEVCAASFTPDPPSRRGWLDRAIHRIFR